MFWKPCGTLHNSLHSGSGLLKRLSDLRPMKKILRALAILIGLILLLLILIPVFFKDQIIDEVKALANENLNATLDFGDTGLSFFSNFPNLTLTLEDLHLANAAPFEGTDLVKAGKVVASVDVMSLFGDQIAVNEIALERPSVNVVVLEDGTANYDITIPSEETNPEPDPVEEAEAGGFNLALQQYRITDGQVTYSDASMPVALSIEDLNHSGSGDFTADQFLLSTQTSASALSLNYDGSEYISNLPLDLQADFDINLAESKYTFKENKLKAGDFPLHADGYVSMPGDDIDMDIAFDAPGSDFRALLSLIPAEFAHDLAGVSASGKVAFDGFVRGTYNAVTMPGMAVNLTVENGGLQYPDLPEKAEDIQVDLHVDASDGIEDDRMKIDLNRFHVEMAGVPLDARFKLRNPYSDPLVDGMVKGRVDLAKLESVVPLEEGDALRGAIDADVTLNGRMSSIENEQYDQFQAEGFVKVADLKYTSDSLDLDAEVAAMDLSFTPAFLRLDQLEASTGESDVQASGRVDNYLAYALRGEPLAGTFNMSSHYLDLNAFMTEEAGAAADSEMEASSEATGEPSGEEMGIIEVPENIDFLLTANIDEVHYDDMTLAQTRGVVRIKEGKAFLQNVETNLLDGQITLDGEYGTADQVPVVNMDFDIRDMDIQQAADNFYTIEKMAPLAKSCQGDFSTVLHMETALNGNMEPIDETLNAAGRVQVDEVYIEKFEPLNKLAGALGMERLAKQSFQDINIGYEVRDGKVMVDPFDVKLDGIPATISGHMTLEQELDYTVDMDFPVDRLPGGAAAQAGSLLGQVNDRLGTNVAMASTVPVRIKIGGTVSNPTYNGGPKEALQSGAQDVKEQAKEAVKEAVEEKVEAVKEDAIAKAQEEADRIMAEAQAQSERLMADATKAAEDAHQKAYAEAQKVQDSYKNPLEKAGKKLAAEGMRKAADEAKQKALDKARKESDALVAKAQERADATIEAAKNK